MSGSEWLSETTVPDVRMGGVNVGPNSREGINPEAGSGYFRTSWYAGEVKPEMARLELYNPGKVVSWGGLYWQYFERLEKITRANTGLSVEKQVMREVYTAAGPQLQAIGTGTGLVKGDRLIVRLVIRSDRDMEYVHLKDMWAAGLEPVNVLSGFRWKGGLSYYEQTGDAATNFFINWLPAGTYVFEYPLVVSQQGSFSNGIATIQCMYAPEFSAHSGGIRISPGMGGDR
jgi:uncharacterized protein YfaS (alpha-2-macroglobulin family)